MVMRYELEHISVDEMDGIEYLFNFELANLMHIFRGLIV